MKARQTDLMFHPEILMELAALSLIESNENPFVVDEKTHKEKKKLFTEEAPTNGFFLHNTLNTYLPNAKELQNKSQQLWSLHMDQVNNAAKTYATILSEVKS